MKLLKKLLTILLATSGALFTVYQFNLDMKLVGWLYNVLHEFHTRKPRKRPLSNQRPLFFCACAMRRQQKSEIFHSRRALRPLELPPLLRNFPRKWAPVGSDRRSSTPFRFAPCAGKSKQSH